MRYLDGHIHVRFLIRRRRWLVEWRVANGADYSRGSIETEWWRLFSRIAIAKSRIITFWDSQCIPNRRIVVLSRT